ncbi:MAG: hypothetical protein KC486_32950, partial [Myxococcales bacterium]|nr:hypothetical protein [Myxococcales bacterium]
VDRFRLQLADPSAPRRFTWDDLTRALEPALRGAAEDPSRPRQIEWRNLYAFDEPTSLLAEPGSVRWKTFGRPPIDADESRPPTASIGWGLSSPALSLSQGRRAITLTLGLRELDGATFARGLGLDPGAYDAEALLARLQAALKIEITTAERWIEAPLLAARLASGAPGDDYWSLLERPRALAEDRPALQLRVVVAPTAGAITALDGARWPTLRVALRHRWDADARAWLTRPAPFDSLILEALHLRVDVDGLVDLRLQHEERPLDPQRPFQPFGARPAVGARLYIGHPELTSPRLDALRFDVTWMGLPASLRAHYQNYPAITGAADLGVRVSLVERGLQLALGEAPLFREGPPPESTTAAEQRLEFADVGGALAAASPGYSYKRSVAALDLPRDLRAAERCLLWELGPRDFGHGIYPTLAAQSARSLAIALARGEADADAIEAHRVDPPHTPTARRLSVGYEASLELRPADASGPGDAVDAEDRLLHIHPFGVSTIDRGAPRLLPRYETAGELYIGLVDVDAPQRLALLVVVADGTSDPDAEPPAVRWSIRDGERWLDLSDRVRHDSTRGL